MIRKTKFGNVMITTPIITDIIITVDLIIKIATVYIAALATNHIKVAGLEAEADHTHLEANYLL